MTQPRFFTFSQARRAPHPHADQRRAHHTTRACRHTQDATSTTQHNGTSASWRVSPNTAHTYKPRTTHRTLTHSMQTHKPRTPARSPAQPQPPRSAQSSLDAHRRAHATYSTAHSSDRPHTPPTENHTQPHTRPPRHTHDRAVRLPSVDGMLPVSWLLLKVNVLQDTRTAIASHHGTRRRCRPQRAARNASQRIA
jgi:hypothetical protein